MALTDRELADPSTLPNPWIKTLLDLIHEINREMLENQTTAPPAVAYQYYRAIQSIQNGIVELFEAKNKLAGEVSDFTRDRAVSKD